MENKMINLLQVLEAKHLFIIFFVSPLFNLSLILSRFGRKRYPPGPPGWPVIGNMGLMDQLTHCGLARLAQKYGGIFHLRMGFLHMVAASSPDAARQVLQAQDNIFSNRPATIVINYLTYDRADKSHDSVRDEVDDMVRTVAISSGSVVNVGELVFGLTRNITFRAAFGSSSHERKDDFIKILPEISKLFAAFNISDFIPLLGWIDPQGIKSRLIKVRAELDGFIDRILDDHMQKARPENGGVVGLL